MDCRTLDRSLIEPNMLTSSDEVLTISSKHASQGIALWLMRRRLKGGVCDDLMMLIEYREAATICEGTIRRDKRCTFITRRENFAAEYDKTAVTPLVTT